MKNTEKDVRQILSAKNVKITKGRCLLLQILIEQERPLSAEEIYRIFMEKGREISLSTVYRIVLTLAEKHIITPLTLPAMDKTLYEYSEKHTHHLVCTQCNKILPLTHCPLEEFTRHIEGNTGFVIQGHSLDMFGVCPDCAKVKEQKAKV